MSQIIIDIGAAANDGTGDPLRTAFNDVNLNFANVFAAGPVDSNVQIVNNTILTTNTNGDLVLAPNGIGRVVANVGVNPNQNNVHNIGSASYRWNTIYAQYADISNLITIDNVSANIISVDNAMQLAVYANASVRDAAITSPQPGMIIYLTNTGMQVRGATQWNTVAGTNT
jgi:hypothetical protein